MSKRNEDFFKAKSEWARVKDQLLECYLKPYAAKILMTNRPLLYVDSFAGKGVFDDGEEGSPLIATRVFEEGLRASHARNPQVKCVFIDREYAADLKRNLPSCEYVSVISGEYEDLPMILEGITDLSVNVFLYIDPYGISSLNMGFFDSIVDAFPSVELLLNFNSFGFFREACRVYGIEYSDVGSFDDLVERDLWDYNSQTAADTRLTTIAGGFYWRDIVTDYRSGAIDGYEAERRLTKEYCSRMMQSFCYVQNFPIRLKAGNRPKYRMVHATCHPEGATLMYGTMCGRKELLLSTIQRGGQLSMFDETVDNEIIDMDELTNTFRSFVLANANEVGDHKLLAEFVVENGVSCPLKVFRGILRDMEQSGEIVISRNPSLTGSGVATRFMESKGNQRLIIRRA